jgi:hypothetical protein
MGEPIEGLNFEGTTKVTYNQSNQRKERHTTLAAKQAYEPLREWKWVSRNEKGVIASLEYQARRRVPGSVPATRVLAQLTKEALQAYPHAPVPEWVSHVYDVKYMYKVILRVLVEQVNKRSGPGVPYHKSGYPQNGPLIENEFPWLTECVYERIMLLLKSSNSSLNARELVQQHYCDPVRLFVKDEPHNRKKRQQGRCRLIMSVSLVDQVIERMLFGNQNKMEIANYPLIPSKPGFGLSDEVKKQEIFRDVSRQCSGDFTTAAEADISGFDWSVKEWELMLDAKFRVLAAGQKFTDDFGKLVLNRVHCLAHAILTTYEGKMYSCVIPGIQLSGSYNTSSTNSRIRWFIARCVGAKWAITMGDDAIEQWVSDAKAKYAALGHPLKNYDRCQSDARAAGFEFCSTKFTPTKCYPADGTKSLYRLIEKDLFIEGPMYLTQFFQQMAGDPCMHRYIGVIADVLLSSHNEWFRKEENSPAQKSATTTKPPKHHNDTSVGLCNEDQTLPTQNSGCQRRVNNCS